MKAILSPLRCYRKLIPHAVIGWIDLSLNVQSKLNGKKKQVPALGGKYADKFSCLRCSQLDQVQEFTQGPLAYIEINRNEFI
jgi:hypothetical protein